LEIENGQNILSRVEKGEQKLGRKELIREAVALKVGCLSSLLSLLF
jgi:hypothetical protein